MPRVPKLPAKASPSPTLLAVASQQLLLVNGLLDEVSRNYVARLRREIADLIRALEQSHANPGPHEKRKLREILQVLSQLQINPEKGRRKDLKKIDTLLSEIHSIVEKS